MFLNKLRSDKLFFNKLVIITALLVASFNSYSQENPQEIPQTLPQESPKLIPEKSAVDNTGWYVGGLLGQVTSEFDNGPTENDVKAGVYAGYNFTPWFGLEGALFSSNQNLDNNTEFSSALLVSFSVTPKFTLAINDTFALYVKTGLSIMTYSTDYTYSADYTDSGWRRYTNSGDSWGGGGATVGVGAEFRLTKGIRLRIAYDYVDAEIENLDYDYYFEEDVDVTLSQASLGIHYQF
jgi:outer membrane immunogenic protein